MLAAVDKISAPSISYAGLAPVLIVLGVASAGVLVEALLPRAQRYPAQLGLAVVGLLAALVAVVAVAGRGELTASGAVAIDGVTLFLQGTLVVLGLLSVLLIAERGVDIGGGALVAQAAVVPGSAVDRRLATTRDMQTEAFPLAMFALGGMMLFPASNNLLLMFVALEVLSLPLYLLAGLARRRRLLSQEAAVKYFLLGAFASAFFLYGVALLYGYAGSADLPAIMRAASGSGRSDILLYLGLAMLVIGLLFKASVAPFHTWTPDVYQGAPTPVTAFMASCTKIAAFGAIVRVLYVGFGNTAWDWRPLVWAAAIITMVVGAVLGLTQTDIKRLLAYSSIAQAGFILIGLISLDGRGLSAVLFYLAMYGFATLGAFGVVTLVRNADGEATHLSEWSGLARRSPLLAAVFTLFLLAFAGIPLTSGFIGKFVLFRAAWATAGPLVVVALLASAVAAFYYVRVIVLMYFSDPAESGPTIAVPSVLTTAAVTVGAAVTLILGLAPQFLLDLADKAAHLVG
jgi:NADH-quinone oxidoreductase subunit N